MQERKRKPTGKGIEATYNLKTMKKDWLKRFAKANKKKMTTVWHDQGTDEAMEEEQKHSLVLESGRLDFSEIEEYLEEASRLGKRRLIPYQREEQIRLALEENKVKQEEFDTFLADYVARKRAEQERTLRVRKVQQNHLFWFTEHISEEHAEQLIALADQGIDGLEVQPHPLARVKVSQPNLNSAEQSTLAVDEYLRSGKKCTEVANKLGLPKWKVQRAVKHFKQGTLNQYLQNQAVPRPGRLKKYGQDLDRFLEAQLRAAQGRLRIRELQAICRLKYPRGPLPSTWLIRARLRAQGIRKKKVAYCPAERNSAQNKGIRLNFMVKLIKYLDSGYKVVSLDETGVNFEEYRGKHYAKANEFWAVQKSLPRMKNISCILAASQHGMEQSMFCERGCDSAIFLKFMLELAKVQQGIIRN